MTPLWHHSGAKSSYFCATMPPPSELTHDCSRTSPDERGVGLHLAQGEPTVAALPRHSLDP